MRKCHVPVDNESSVRSGTAGGRRLYERVRIRIPKVDRVGAEKKKVKRCANLSTSLMLMGRSLNVRLLLCLVEVWVVWELLGRLVVELELLVLLVGWLTKNASVSVS